MTADPNEVMTVYAGPLVVAEAYKQALEDAGIESRMTGDALLASFGTAVPGAIELFVHRRDFDKAVTAIQRYEENREKPEGEAHAPPTDSAKPEGAKHPIKHHIPPHPTGQ